MASHASGMLDDILLAWRTSHTHEDLSSVSGTHKVVVDEDLKPTTSVPFVSLGSPAEFDIVGSSITPLTQYQITATIRWCAAVATELDDTEERAKAAANLASDLVLAIQAAQPDPVTYPTLARCTDVVQRVLYIRGDASSDGLSFGEVMGEITYTAIVAGGI